MSRAEPAIEVLAVPRAAAGARLDRFLAAALALPVERARALIEAGRVRIRGKACSPHRKLFGGEEVAVERPAPRPAPSAGPPLATLHDDADCLVVDSRPGSRWSRPGRAAPR